MFPMEDAHQHSVSRTSRSEISSKRKQERRRRMQRRLLPLLMASFLILALAVWVLAPPTQEGHLGPAILVSTSSSAPTTTTTKAPFQPIPVSPVITPANAGEGQWAPADTWYPPAPKAPAVMTTTWRPDPSQPSIVAYAVWMRSHTTSLALFPGYQGPGATTLDRGPTQIPSSSQGRLLASFNSGFYEADSAEGFFTHHTLYFPMVNNHATVLSRSDGSVDIVNWTGGASPDASITMARQNLTLLVNDGKPGAGTDIGSNWGLTLHGVPAVWRTALGIDRAGNLIYASAPAQTAASMAQIMIQAGAIRAMQLDINPEWPIYVTYAGPGAQGPSLFIPNPNQVANRFLYSSTKDFFALYEKFAPGAEQPW